MSLEGKTALVTGAAQRLGRGIALALAAEGANIVVHYNTSEDEAGRLRVEIEEVGVSSWTVQCDLRDEGAVEGLLPRVRQMAGPVNVLVNNASIFPEDTLRDFRLASLEDSVRINAYGPLRLGHHLADDGVEGNVVNLLDARMEDYVRTHVSYHLSKRMLYDFTRMQALELAPKVRVNGVAPGLILPPSGHGTEYLESRTSTTPLNRYGSVDDVARAVLFLVNSPFVTGQVIFVDGGRHMKGAVYG